MNLAQLKLSKTAIEKLIKLNITTIEQLYLTLPNRYDDYTIDDITLLKNKDQCVFEAVITSVPFFSYFKTKVSFARFTVSIQGLTLNCVIFNRYYLKSKLKKNHNILIVGKYNHKKNAFVISDLRIKNVDSYPKIVCYYSLRGLIKDYHFKNYVAKSIDNLNYIDTLIPDSLLKRHGLCHKLDAIKYLHFPKNSAQLKAGLSFIRYEEFFNFQILTRAISKLSEKESELFKKEFDYDSVFAFIDSFSFTLTKDQLNTINEVLSDMSQQKIMHRLIQGDVGCGKTAVAMVAIYANFLAGYQSVFMAPTELLARQHFQVLFNALSKFNVKVAMLTGKTTAANRKLIIQGLKLHEIDVLIGTHALIQPDILFDKLGLVITDEQQRFGVKQRQLLKAKSPFADFLLMSATPIPRTLALTLFHDMSLSTIKTMPMNRLSVISKYIKQNSIKPILDDIEKYLLTGQQMYIVCPIIEQDINLELKDVNTIYNSISKYFKGMYKVGMVHGKMTNSEKEKVMEKFNENNLQILVATTVIEVGIHVSNANMMIIYNADRFGLSQLHQLRGRVGRDQKQGYCYFLSDAKEKEITHRLHFLEDTLDGFIIAQYDLEKRGAGDLLGQSQSGQLPFIFADIYRDFNIFELAKIDACDIINNVEAWEKIKEKVIASLGNNNLMID